VNGLEVMLEEFAHDVTRAADALELIAALMFFSEAWTFEPLRHHPSLLGATRLAQNARRQSDAKDGDDGE
jgi:hypothetical protein